MGSKLSLGCDVAIEMGDIVTSDMLRLAVWHGLGPAFSRHSFGALAWMSFQSADWSVIAAVLLKITQTISDGYVGMLYATNKVPRGKVMVTYIYTVLSTYRELSTELSNVH